MSKVIIAKYKENVDWVKDLPEGFEAIVIDKEKGDLPNLAGREAHTYLDYIYNNYDDLKGDYIFCQGNPFDHAKDFFNDIQQQTTGFLPIGEWITESDNKGKPHHPGLPIEKYCIDLGLPHKHKYHFTAGGQFKVTATKLKSLPKEWYLIALELSETDTSSGYVFERLWQTIYENT